MNSRSSGATISPRRPASTRNRCCLRSRSAWPIGWRDTASLRATDSCVMRSPGSRRPSQIASRMARYACSTIVGAGVSVSTAAPAQGFGISRMSPYHASDRLAGVVGVGHHADLHQRAGRLAERLLVVVAPVARDASATRRRRVAAGDHDHLDALGVRIGHDRAHRHVRGVDVHQRRVRQRAVPPAARSPSRPCARLQRAASSGRRRTPCSTRTGASSFAPSAGSALASGAAIFQRHCDASAGSPSRAAPRGRGRWPRARRAPSARRSRRRRRARSASGTLRSLILNARPGGRQRAARPCPRRTA